MLALVTPQNVVGVFTDVNGEHPDNYRFLAEVQYALGSRLVKVTNDGRTIWDVFLENRFLGNTRVDVCSRVLKREAFRRWLAANVDPEQVTIALGIDWSEIHRFEPLVAAPSRRTSASGGRYCNSYIRCEMELLLRRLSELDEGGTPSRQPSKSAPRGCRRRKLS